MRRHVWVIERWMEGEKRWTVEYACEARVNARWNRDYLKAIHRHDKFRITKYEAVR